MYHIFLRKREVNYMLYFSYVYLFCVIMFFFRILASPFIFKNVLFIVVAKTSLKPVYKKTYFSQNVLSPLFLCISRNKYLQFRFNTHISSPISFCQEEYLAPTESLPFLDNLTQVTGVKWPRMNTKHEFVKFSYI